MEKIETYGFGYDWGLQLKPKLKLRSTFFPPWEATPAPHSRPFMAWTTFTEVTPSAAGVWRKMFAFPWLVSRTALAPETPTKLPGETSVSPRRPIPTGRRIGVILPRFYARVIRARQGLENHCAQRQREEESGPAVAAEVVVYSWRGYSSLAAPVVVDADAAIVSGNIQAAVSYPNLRYRRAVPGAVAIEIVPHVDDAKVRIGVCRVPRE